MVLINWLDNLRNFVCLCISLGSKVPIKLQVRPDNSEYWITKCCITVSLLYYYFTKLYNMPYIISLLNIWLCAIIISSDGEDVYCMEVSCSLRDKPHFLGSPGTTERRIWMQKLLESLTLVFSPRLTAEYIRAGWCFLKVWKSYMIYSKQLQSHILMQIMTIFLIIAFT